MSPATTTTTTNNSRWLASGPRGVLSLTTAVASSHFSTVLIRVIGAILSRVRTLWVKFHPVPKKDWLLGRSPATIHHFHRINVVIFLLLLLLAGSPFGERERLIVPLARLHIAPSDLMWQPSPSSRIELLFFANGYRNAVGAFSLSLSLITFFASMRVVATNRVQPPQAAAGDQI